MVVSWLVQQGIYTAFLGMGFVLAYIPLYWHVEAWNMGTVLWIFWSGTGCLVYFINAVVWRDNLINWAPVWCDIVTRFMHIQPIGIALASALINHRLYRLSKLTKSFTTLADKRRMAIIDLSIGLGVPTVFLATYWFIQGHRFDIIEGVGCMPTMPVTTVWLFTYAVWPSIITSVSACFGIFTIKQFMKHRREFDSIVSSSVDRKLTSYRYFRLMLFASLDAFIFLPLNIVLLVFGANQPFYPWNGLADLHINFSRVGLFPAALWRTNQHTITEILITPGASIGSAFMFFAFFGLAEEARVHYRLLFNATREWCDRLTGRSTTETDGWQRSFEPKQKTGILSHLTMPSFVQRMPTLHRHRQRQDSVDSVLTVAITIDDFASYDGDIELGDVPRSPSAPPYLPEKDAKWINAQVRDAMYPPSLIQPPGLAHLRHASSDSRSFRTPPRHSFHGPKSVLGTMDSLASL